MKYINIQEKLENLFIFSTQDLKILDDKYYKSKLTKWKKAGYINQVIRGYYILGNIEVNQNLLFHISNKIYSPSYISLNSVFSYYGLIPEQTFSITAVSTKKTNIFNSDTGVFDYKKIKSDLFWGYDIVKVGKYKILIASLEKAIIDYLYLDNSIVSIDDFKSLRFNKDILKDKIDKLLLKKYSKMVNKKVLSNKINLLFKYMEND